MTDQKKIVVTSGGYPVQHTAARFEDQDGLLVLSDASDGVVALYAPGCWESVSFDERGA